MNLSIDINIKAKKEKVWKIISDIENIKNVVKGIEKVQILEKPSNGIIGLKWVETRIMFGKEATETMWITDAEENKYFKTRAENCGAIYESSFSLVEDGNHTKLTVNFKSTTNSLFAKIMTPIFSLFLKGSMIKAFKKDLEDIKKAAEQDV